MTVMLRNSLSTAIIYDCCTQAVDRSSNFYDICDRTKDRMSNLRLLFFGRSKGSYCLHIQIFFFLQFSCCFLILSCVGISLSLTLSSFASFCGPVSSRDNRVLKGPLGRSLRSFARTAHSAHSLRSAPLRYACFATLASLRSLRLLAPFTGLLTHFAHSLVGQWKFMNLCSR